MNSLLMLALLLIGVWVVVVLVFKVVGMLIHILLLIGAILFVAWIWQKLSNRSTTGGP